MIEAKANLVQKLLEASENPKPSYKIDGQEVDWKGYIKMLQDAIDRLSTLIASEEDDWEEMSQWYV